MLSARLPGIFPKFVACVVLLLLLIGCRSSSLELLQGNYISMSPGTDHQANGLSLPGSWGLKLADDSRFTVLNDGEVVVEGRYTVEENQLEFTDEKGPLACQAEQETGIYKWALEGKTLTLTLVDDKCDGRKGVLAARLFLKQP